jgi:ABC-type nitrate/sulfonate/bicarbonate transport system ATPase subunit
MPIATAAERPVLEMRDVSMEFAARDGVVRAVDRVSLAFCEGDFVCVVGPSGCGKTTLLRIIAGFVRPTAGDASLDGTVITGPDHQRGVVFQQPALYPWLTVQENVEFGPKMRGVPAAERRAIAERYLKLVRLWDFRGKAPYELSGGMQQRVAIARVLANDPRILLMDEPFGALDALSRDQAMIDLQQIWSANRKTVLFVTHHVPEAVFLSDHVVMMTPRPGRVDRVLRIDLPRPRRLKMRAAPAFAAYVQEILGILQSWGVLVEEPEDGVPG